MSVRSQARPGTSPNKPTAASSSKASTSGTRRTNRAGRLKQWLNLVRLRLLEAQALYYTLRPLNYPLEVEAVKGLGFPELGIKSAAAAFCLLDCAP